MTAKECADEIWKPFYLDIQSTNPKEAIQCAIIHVKGIIDECREFNSDRESFWYDVLQELNQM